MGGRVYVKKKLAAEATDVRPTLLVIETHLVGTENAIIKQGRDWLAAQIPLDTV